MLYGTTANVSMRITTHYLEAYLTFELVSLLNPFSYYASLDKYNIPKYVDIKYGYVDTKVYRKERKLRTSLKCMFINMSVFNLPGRSLMLSLMIFPRSDFLFWEKLKGSPLIPPFPVKKYRYPSVGPKRS
jgi:hypothetical protein